MNAISIEKFIICVVTNSKLAGGDSYILTWNYVDLYNCNVVF